MFVEHKEAGEQQTKPLDKTGILMLRIAEFIERNGLSCGGQVDHRGRKCLVRIAGELGNGEGQMQVMRRLLKAFPEVEGLGMGRWSDNMPAAEMVKKLRAVALGPVKVVPSFVTNRFRSAKLFSPATSMTDFRKCLMFARTSRVRKIAFGKMVAVVNERNSDERRNLAITAMGAW